MRLKNFMLKSVPYILSVAGGMAIYFLAIDNIHDDNLNGLLSNVAASLLAIPLIFVLYEYVTYILSKNVNAKLSESLLFDVNSIVLKILKDVRIMMQIKQPMTWVGIEKMLHTKASEIKTKLKVTATDIEFLKKHKKQMNELAYKLARADVLPDHQVQLVMAITREAARVVNEWQYKGNSAALPKYIENLLSVIDDWFDSCEREALHSHEQFQLTIEQEAKSAPGNKSKKV